MSQRRETDKNSKSIKPDMHRVQALADISRSRYVAIATQPVHQLQIRPVVPNRAASTTPPSYIRVRAVVWAYGRGQTHRQDTQTRMTTIHFASSTTHAKYN